MSPSAPSSRALPHAGVPDGTSGSGGRLRPTASGSRPMSEPVAGLILIAPVLLLFAVSVVYPLFDTIRLSFYDIKGLGQPRYIGFGNYLKLFADPAFRNTIWTTVIWTVCTTAISVGIGWLLAMMCSFAPKSTLPFRVMIFAAFGISEAVSGFMWLGIFRPDQSGLLNAVLGAIGLGQFQHAWLGDPNTALWGLIVAASWAQVGLPLMLCFASVQSIPSNVLEAAAMDGAGPRALMRYIMMPLSMPGVRVAVFINLLGSLRAFDIIYVLTGGGPVRSTETIGFFMYRESMTQFKLGYGAAATVILLIAVFVISAPAIIQRTAGAR